MKNAERHYSVPAESIGEFLSGIEENTPTGKLTYEGQIPLLISTEPQNPYATRNPYAVYESEEHAQPFLFQMALFSTRASGGDISWLDDEMYRKLKKYLKHWTTSWDRDSNGLSEWASAPHAIASAIFHGKPARKLKKPSASAMTPPTSPPLP